MYKNIFIYFCIYYFYRLILYFCVKYAVLNKPIPLIIVSIFEINKFSIYILVNNFVHIMCYHFITLIRF